MKTVHFYIKIMRKILRMQEPLSVGYQNNYTVFPLMNIFRSFKDYISLDDLNINWYLNRFGIVSYPHKQISYWEFNRLFFLFNKNIYVPTKIDVLCELVRYMMT